MASPDRNPARVNRLVLAGLCTVVFGMGALSFAAVPLYDLFCRVTGWGGTPQIAEGAAPDGAVLDRTMRVRFAASTGHGLPWTFTPETTEIEVRVGEPAIVYYRAENRSSLPVGGQATFNVAPDKTGAYFVKVECFCFTEQILDPGQTAELPVYFYLDPALDADPALDDVRVVTLSYTFYPHESEAVAARVARWQEETAGAAGAAPTGT